MIPSAPPSVTVCSKGNRKYSTISCALVFAVKLCLIHVVPSTVESSMSYPTKSADAYIYLVQCEIHGSELKGVDTAHCPNYIIVD